MNSTTSPSSSTPVKHPHLLQFVRLPDYAFSPEILSKLDGHLEKPLQGIYQCFGIDPFSFLFSQGFLESGSHMMDEPPLSWSPLLTSRLAGVVKGLKLQDIFDLDGYTLTKHPLFVHKAFVGAKQPISAGTLDSMKDNLISLEMFLSLVLGIVPKYNHASGVPISNLSPVWVPVVFKKEIYFMKIFHTGGIHDHQWAACRFTRDEIREMGGLKGGNLLLSCPAPEGFEMPV